MAFIQTFPSPLPSINLNLWCCLITISPCSTSISAFSIVRNDIDKSNVYTLKSIISITIMYVGKMNLSTLTSTFSTIPSTFVHEQYARSTIASHGCNFTHPILLNVDNVIRLKLDPKSH